MNRTTGSVEASSFPLTGDFLAGRLRQNLSLDDLKYIEALVETVSDHGDTARLLARGTKTDRSTILIEGYIFRTVESGDKRFITGVHVPGDFVDLHGFALSGSMATPMLLGYGGFGQSRGTARRRARSAGVARHVVCHAARSGDPPRIQTLEQLDAPRRIAHLAPNCTRGSN